MVSEDYQALVDGNVSFLWNKWKGVALSFWRKVYRAKEQYNINIEFDSFDDFNCSCYEIAAKAIGAVKLNKIKNPDTWTFYQQYWHYLSNYTQRDIVRPALYDKMFKDAILTDSWTEELGRKIGGHGCPPPKKPMSEEHKRKIAESQKLRHLKRKGLINQQ